MLKHEKYPRKRKVVHPLNCGRGNGHWGLENHSAYVVTYQLDEKLHLAKTFMPIGQQRNRKSDVVTSDSGTHGLGGVSWDGETKGAELLRTSSVQPKRPSSLAMRMRRRFPAQENSQRNVMVREGLIKSTKPPLKR